MNPNDSELETDLLQPVDFSEETREISERLHGWFARGNADRLRAHKKLVVARNAGTWNSQKICGFTFCPSPHYEDGRLPPAASGDPTGAKGNNVVTVATKRNVQNVTNKPDASITKRTKEAGQKASKGQLQSVDGAPVLVVRRDQFLKPAAKEPGKTPRDGRVNREVAGSVPYRHGVPVEQVLKEYREANMYSRPRVTKVNKKELACAILSVRPPVAQSPHAQPASVAQSLVALSQPRRDFEREEEESGTARERGRSNRILAAAVPREDTSGPYLQVCSLTFGPQPHLKSRLTALRPESPPPPARRESPHEAHSLPAALDAGAKTSTYALLLGEQGRMADARAKCRETEATTSTVKYLLKGDAAEAKPRGDAKAKRGLEQLRPSVVRLGGDGRGDINPPAPAIPPNTKEPRYRITLDFDGPGRSGNPRAEPPPRQRKAKKAAGKRPAKKKPEDKTGLFLSGIPIEAPRAIRPSVTRILPDRNAQLQTVDKAMATNDEGSPRIHEILSPRFGPDDGPHSDNEIIIRGFLGLDADDPRPDFDIVLDSETLGRLDGPRREEIARMNAPGREPSTCELAGSRSVPVMRAEQDTRLDGLLARTAALRSRLRSDPLLAVAGDATNESREVATLVERLKVDRPRRTSDFRGRAMQSGYLQKYERAGLDRLRLGGVTPRGGEEEIHPNSPAGGDFADAVAAFGLAASGADNGLVFETEYPYPKCLAGTVDADIAGDNEPVSHAKYPKSHTVGCGPEPLDSQQVYHLADTTADNDPISNTTFAKNAPTSHTVGCGTEPHIGLTARETELHRDVGLILDNAEPGKSLRKSVRFSDTACNVRSSRATTDLSQDTGGGFDGRSELERLEADATTSQRYLEYVRASAALGGPGRLPATGDAPPNRLPAKSSAAPGRLPATGGSSLEVTANRLSVTGDAPPSRLPAKSSAAPSRLPATGGSALDVTANRLSVTGDAPPITLPATGDAPPNRLPAKSSAASGRLPATGGSSLDVTVNKLSVKGDAPLSRLPAKSSAAPSRLPATGDAPLSRLPATSSAAPSRLPATSSVPLNRLPATSSAAPSRLLATSGASLEVTVNRLSVTSGAPPSRLPATSFSALDVTPNRGMANQIAVDGRSSTSPFANPFAADAETTEGTPGKNQQQYTELSKSYADLLSRLKQVNNVNNQYKHKKRR